MKNEQNLKRGDLVWISDLDSTEKRSKRIFIEYIEGAQCPFICVTKCTEVEYDRGMKFTFNAWKYATKVESTDYTIDQLLGMVSELFKNKNL
jgi:hypothetical protein